MSESCWLGHRPPARRPLRAVTTALTAAGCGSHWRSRPPLRVRNGALVMHRAARLRSVNCPQNDNRAPSRHGKPPRSLRSLDPKVSASSRSRTRYARLFRRIRSACSASEANIFLKVEELGVDRVVDELGVNFLMRAIEQTAKTPRRHATGCARATSGRRCERQTAPHRAPKTLKQTYSGRSTRWAAPGFSTVLKPDQ